MALKAEEVYAILKKQIQSGGATPEQIQQAVDAYLEENPVQPGATVEQAAQIEQNKTDISSVKEDVSSLSEEIGNYVLYAQFNLQGYLSNTGGFIQYGGDDVKSTDFIESTGSKILYKLYGGNGVGLICFYDKNKKFISSITDNSGVYVYGETDIPENAVYYRACNFDRSENKENTYAIMTLTYDYIQKSISQSIESANFAIKNLNKKPDAVIEISDYSLNGYINKKGIIVENSSSIRTDFQYCYYANSIKFRLAEVSNALMIAFYDKNRKFISGVSGYGENLEMIEDEVDIPQNAYYFISAMWNDNPAVENEEYYTKLVIDFQLIAEKTKEIDSFVSHEKSKVEYKYGDSLLKPFEFNGKKITGFGDSITFGVSSPNLGNAGNNKYISLFSTKVGATLVNKAVSGSCITDSDGVTNSIYDVITSFTDETDFIFISGGINDYATGKNLGSYGDEDAHTFYGALKGICEFLKNNYSDATVIFITPVNVTGIWDASIHELNEYRNAIYEVATAYKFNVVDGSTLGLPTEPGAWGNEMIDDSDRCHPTILGHYQYYKGLCGKLL